MVKTVLGVHHQGLREWIIQRSSAIILALYSIGLIFYFVSHPDLSFAEWHYAFSQTWVKVFTMLAILALLYHAWIGVWTIFTDYIKFPTLRVIIDSLVFFLLFACFFWGMLIVWSV